MRAFQIHTCENANTSCAPPVDCNQCRYAMIPETANKKRKNAAGEGGTKGQSRVGVDTYFELPVRSCFGGVAFYPPHVLLDSRCGYFHQETLQTAVWPKPVHLESKGSGPSGRSHFVPDHLQSPAAAVPPFPATAYTDADQKTCEHIGLHFCIEAVFNTTIKVDSRLRVWYRRVDRGANDVQLGRNSP